jgi:hypothetical protein
MKLVAMEKAGDEDAVASLKERLKKTTWTSSRRSSSSASERVAPVHRRTIAGENTRRSDRSEMTGRARGPWSRPARE